MKDIRFNSIQIYLILFTLICTNSVFGQKKMYRWYFGSNISFEWDCSNDYIFSADTNPINSFSSPCSTSDNDGNFLFAVNPTDWVTVGQETVGGIYDRTGELMALSGGGEADLYDNVTGSSGYAYGFQVSENIWYTVYNYSLSTISANYYYSVIDMSLPGNGTIDEPAGEVTEHRVFFKNSSKYNFTVTRHDNGIDHWVVIAETNQISAYQVTSGGILTPVVSVLPIIPSGSILHKVSQMAFSPDGSKLAYQWGVIDFDITTGVFSNIQHIPSGSLNCFSPNCKYLYRGKKDWISGESYILRYETEGLISTSLPYDTVGFHPPVDSEFSWAPNWGSKSILHSDGNIYFKDGTYGDMSVIHNPNTDPTIVMNEIMFSDDGSWWSSEYEPGSWGFGSLPNFITSWAVEVTAETVENEQVFASCDSIVYAFNGTHCGLVTTEEWFFGDGSESVEESSPSHAYSTPGTYEVLYIVRNDSTCSKWNTDTLRTTITIDPEETLAPIILDLPSTACSGDEAFDLTASPDLGTWMGLGIIDETTGLFDPSVAGPGLHEIIFLSAGTCPGSDTAYIEISPSEMVSLTYEGGPWCANTEIIMPSMEGTDGGIFSTASGLVINPTTGEIDLSTITAGVYEIIYTSTGECPGTDNYTLEILPQPIADFQFSPGEIILDDPTVDFINYSNNANSYLWEFGDSFGTSTEENPTHIYPSEINTYNATLWAYSEIESCYDSITKEISVVDDLIFYVPNAFTPDGDQFNQTFKPIFNDRIDESSYHLIIYNRWGEKLFESYNPAYGWNGAYGDMGLCASGVYIWQINYRVVNSDYKEQLIGHVTLLK